MRPIKLRAWLLNLKHMVEVYEINFTRKGYSIRIKGFDYRHYKTFTQDEAILMQFTGLFDKNRKETYEGDIVENYAMRDIVIFHNGAFVGKNSRKDHLGQYQPIAVHNEIEIVGNIYENPNLLKEPSND